MAVGQKPTTKVSLLRDDSLLNPTGCLFKGLLGVDNKAPDPLSSWAGHDLEDADLSRIERKKKKKPTENEWKKSIIASTYHIYHLVPSIY